MIKTKLIFVGVILFFIIFSIPSVLAVVVPGGEYGAIAKPIVNNYYYYNQSFQNVTIYNGTSYNLTYENYWNNYGQYWYNHTQSVFDLWGQWFYNQTDAAINWVQEQGYLTNITNYTETDPIFSAWDKDYSDLINKPTHLSNFTDDLGDRGYTYLSNFTDDIDYSIKNVNRSNFWDDLDSPLDSWLSTYNATYDSKVSYAFGDCPTGQVVMNTTISGVQCITPTGDGSYNVTYEATTNDVNANRSSWFSTYNSTYDAKNSSQWIRTDGNIYYQNLTGRVGIGTNNPSYKLHITDNVNGGLQMAIINPNTGSSSYANYIISSDSAVGRLVAFSSTYGEPYQGDIALYTTGANDLMFGTGSTPNEMIIKNGGAGKVGIGTMNPTQKLDVNGSVNITGNITADWGFMKINSSNIQNPIIYYSDEVWINKNSSYAFVFNASQLSTIYYNATQSQAVVGTIDGGTLVDTQHPDGKYEGKTFNFSEVSATPGLDLRINFTGVDSFNQGIMRYKTSSGLAGAYPIIQMWNYDTSTWEDYPPVAQSTTFATIEQPVFDAVDHIDINGVAQMRIYKATKGNTGNHYYVDWLAIAKGYGTPSGEEVDPYSVHLDGSTPLTANWDAGLFNITADWFNGNLNWNNIQNINQSIYSTYNTTYALWAYNQTTSAIDDINSRFWNKTQTYNKTEIDSNLSNYYLVSNPLNFLNVTTISNQTIARIGDCPSGQVVQNTTTSGVQCIVPPAGSETDPLWTANSSLVAYTNQQGNWTVNSSQYWDNLDSFNSTQMENNGGTLNILESWFSSLFDALFGAKTTDDLTQGSTNFYDNKSWNQSLANVLYAPISVTGDNSSWNQSLADALYAEIQWGYNMTIPANSYTDTKVATANLHLHSINNITMDNNLNMSGKNITNINSVNYQNSSGANVWRTYYNGSALITEFIG